MQILPEEDMQKHGFDLLDPTKVLPEELVPVQRVGKLVLDRIAALQFELGKVERPEIRERMVNQILVNIDTELAIRVARAVGVEPPKADKPAKADKRRMTLESAPSLSMENTPKDSIRTRKVAVLVADGFSSKELAPVRKALLAGGAIVEVVAPRLGPIKSREGDEETPVKTFLTAASVLYDAIYVPGGEASIATLKLLADAMEFVRDAYRHCKAVGLSGEATLLVEAAGLSQMPTAQPLEADPGVVQSAKSDMKKFSKLFVAAIAAHRNWAREAPPPA